MEPIYSIELEQISKTYLNKTSSYILRLKMPIIHLNLLLQFDQLNFCLIKKLRNE